ncbi:hypothetical protein [uncultured Porphyromonas sp.]|uniref:InlB B-repeat-containing protein n=1 Tax=uncultured Porphyromonas sp. TaxID=159274 RepID=UPI0025F04A20|nr:hypothetical protein [uncultured Porphyromonas sp.]
MKRPLPLMLTLLTLLLTALTSTAQETAVITFSSTEGGTVSATNKSDWMPIQSGAELPVGTQISLEVTLSNQDTHYIKGWIVNGIASYPYANQIEEYTIQSGENNIQAVVDPIPAEGFLVTIHAGDGGKITKSERMDENYNWHPFTSGDRLPARRSVHVVAEPDRGYGVERWTVNGKSWGENNECWAFTSSPLDIEVTFKKINYYKVYFSTNTEYGSIQAVYTTKDGLDAQFTSGDDLPEGVKVTFLVTPNEGYKIDKWIVNNVEETPDNRYPNRLQKTLTEELTVEAHLVKLPPKHSIQLSHGSGGSIEAQFVDPADGWNAQFDSQKDIQEGVEVTVRATPDPNFMIDKWYYNDKEVSPSASDPNVYVFTVTEPATISATFKEGQAGYIFNYSAGEHGSIEKAEVALPSGIVPFKSGESLPSGRTVTLTAKPDKGYDVDQWYVNDQMLPLYAGRTTCEILVNGPIDARVTFKKGAPAQYPVTFSIEGGVIVVKYKKDPSSDEYTIIRSGDLVMEDTELLVWVKPGGDNVVKEWYINNSLREDLAGRTEASVVVTDATNIKVVCEAPMPTSYKLTYTAGTHGSIVAKGTDDKEIASGADVEINAKVTLTATPDEGFEVEKWVVNGTERSDKNLSIELTMDKDQVVEVTFIKKIVMYELSYAITPSTQGELMVINSKTQEQIPSGSKLPEGTEITCQVSIPTGSMWQLDKWMINGTVYPKGGKGHTITLAMSQDLQIEAVLLDHTSVATPTRSGYIVSVEAGQLFIHGLVEPTQIDLYNAVGELILSRQIETSSIAIDELPQGIYYLLIKGETFKVVR